MTFSYSDSVGALPQICGKQQFDAIVDSPRVKQVCERVAVCADRLAATADEAVRRSHLDEISRWKRRLPVFIFLAWFDEGKPRRREFAHASGLTMLDIDHCTDPRGLWQRISSRAMELDVWLAHVTPSTRGLRLVFRTPAGMTNAEAMRYMADALGIEEYDTCTFDLPRSSFAVPRSYVLHLDDRLFGDPETPDAQPAPSPETLLPEERAAKADGFYCEEVTGEERRVKEGGDMDVASFKGIPFTDIVDRLLFLMGVDGEPSEGERNNTLYALVRELRYICDFSLDALMALVPRWGMTEAEVRATVQSALGTVRSQQMPGRLEKVLKTLEAERRFSDTESAAASAQTKLPLPRLPRMLQLIVKPFPEEFRPAVLVMALPLLGTLATAVRATYLDGVEMSLTFFTCLRAQQAGGKSFARRLIDRLLCFLLDEDAVGRVAERKYMEARQAQKNAKQQPEDPRPVIRVLPPTISNAALFKRLDNARGRHCFLFSEEIDSLSKARKTAFSQKDDLFRLAFDNAMAGNDVLHTDSWCTMVNVYLNLLICGTPHAVSRYFNDVENGLVSRVCFCTIPDLLGAPIPRIASLTKREDAELDIAIRRLMDEGSESEDGRAYYDTPRLRKAVNRWLEEKRLEFLESQENPALEILRRRAGVIGFRAGVLAMLLCDHKETQVALDFATWVASYVLEQQLMLFGDQMNELLRSDPTLYGMPYGQRFGAVKKLFCTLPEEFTTDQLLAARRAAGMSGNVGMVISRWIRNDMLERIDKNLFRKLEVKIIEN